MRTLAIGIFTLAFLTGCGDTIHGRSIAEPQVGEIHLRLNEERFDEIYSNASEEFRKSGSKDKVLELFDAFHRKLGEVKSWNLTSWSVRTFNFKTIVVLVVDTQFERGKGVETFTFRVSGKKAELLGYNINSADMLIK